VAGACEYNDEPLGSGAMELVVYFLSYVSFENETQFLTLNCRAVFLNHCATL
jgi:hypothetical protein